MDVIFLSEFETDRPKSEELSLAGSGALILGADGDGHPAGRGTLIHPVGVDTVIDRGEEDQSNNSDDLEEDSKDDDKITQGMEGEKKWWLIWTKGPGIVIRAGTRPRRRGRSARR